MEEIRTFQGGMNKDFHISNMPQGTYSHAENFVQWDNEGELGGLLSEKGFEEVTTLPADHNVIGYTVLDKDIIVFLVNTLGHSEIGVITNKVYTKSLPQASGNSELNFSLTNPIQAEARKLLTGERMVYFTDFNNSMRYVSLDNPPADNSIDDNVKVISNQNLAKIDLASIEENVGDLRVGMYFFIPQYLSEDLTPLALGLSSAGVPIVDDLRAGGALNYDGEYQDVGKVNKTINLLVSNIDTSFAYIRLVVVYFEGSSNIPIAEALPLKLITSTSLPLSYSGAEETTSITQEELRFIPISYSKAKTVAQKDNRLFWGNLADKSQEFDKELQKLFNDATVSYDITEVPYSDRLGAASSFFSLSSVPYVKGEVAPDTSFIILDLTAPADATASLVTTIYSLETGGAQAIGNIEIADANNFFTDPNYDSFDIAGVVFTAVNGAVTLGDATFDASSLDADTIAISIATQVNAHPTTSPLVFGLAIASDIQLTAVTVGVAGNSLALTYTNSNASIAATVTAFAGGVASATVNPIEVTTNATYDQVILEFLDPIGISAVLNITNLPDATGNINLTETNLSVSPFPLTDTGLDPDIGYSSYKDESFTFYLKGYRRNEVYSLGGMVNYKDGSQSFAYHIPGNIKVGLPPSDNFFPANATTKELGTYVSEKEYPIAQNYPGTNIGDDTSLSSTDRFIRHHKMPSLEQEPHFRNDGTQRFIRILGIKITLNKAITPALAKELQSISFVRQRRNSSQNRSVWMQGLPTRYVKTDDDYSGGGAGSNPFYKKMPFCNGTTVTNNDTFTGGTTRPSLAFTYTDVRDREMAFFSPDASLYPFNPNNAIGARLKPVLGLQGRVEFNLFKKSEHVFKTQYYSISAYTADLRYFYLSWLGVSYMNTKAVSGSDAPLVTDALYVPNKETIKVESLGPDKIDNRRSSRHLYLKTADNENVVSFGTPNNINLSHKIELGRPIALETTKGQVNSDYFNVSSIEANLLSMETENNNQYGEIGSGEYLLISTSQNLPIIAGSIYSDIYEGDTFIGGYAFRNSDIWNYKALRKTASFLIVDTSYSIANEAESHVDQTSGMDLRCISYLLLESDVNTEYRHTFTDRSDPDNPKLEPTYYPKTDFREANQVFVESGDSRGYNTQYSFENLVKTFNVKPPQGKVLAGFQNRIIYSERDVKDSLKDNYRLYPQNNYYDLPSHTGEIWNLFVHAGMLFAHTPKSLWKTFVNPTAQQATEIGEVVLGVGGIFSLPSVPVVTTDGGYGGSISQFCTIITPFGVVFPDVLQAKVFMLVGSQLTELSGSISRLLSETMGEGLKETYADNPFLGIGYNGAYDFTYKRFMLTKRGASPKTLSYSFISKTWVSEHSYYPDVYIPFDKDLFSFKGNSMYEHNIGDYGVFYDTARDSILIVPFTTYPGTDKTFDNLVLQTKSFSEEGLVKLHTFTELQAYTDLRNTDAYIIEPKGVLQFTTADKVRATYLKSKYLLAIPGDAVINDDLNIFEPTNLDKTSLFKQRMKGDWLEVKFTLDNVSNLKFIANFIGLIFRENAN